MMHRAAVTVSELSDMADPGREERGDHIAAAVRAPAVRVASLAPPGVAQRLSCLPGRRAAQTRGPPLRLLPHCEERSSSVVIARSAATKQPRAPTPGLRAEGPGLLRL